MTDQPKGTDALSDVMTQWAEQWQKFADVSISASEAWSGSMLPFIAGRAAEKRGMIGDEMSEAIERLAQGPKFADVWDIDRKLMQSFMAWNRMRQKLMAYNANVAGPWMRAFDRHRDAPSETQGGGARQNWRDDFAAWSAVANEEFISNQRSEEFLKIQRELLQAGIEFRKTQNELSETLATIIGIPTQKDFDELSRQITELRRELRQLAREKPNTSSERKRVSSRKKEANDG